MSEKQNLQTIKTKIKMSKFVNLLYFNTMCCPKCGGNMTMGASHIGSGYQWECHCCGTIINP